MATPNTFINDINEACELFEFANPGRRAPRALIAAALLRGDTVDEASTIPAVGFPKAPTTGRGEGVPMRPRPFNEPGGITYTGPGRDW